MNRETLNRSGVLPMVNALDLLTVPEAAKMLKVSAVTLRRWIKQGRLPAYHVGPRQVRIRQEDLTKVLTPTRPAEGSAIKEGTPISTTLTVRPLTEDEVAQQLRAIEESEAFIERMRAKRGGELLSSSAPLIRRARAERSRQLL